MIQMMLSFSLLRFHVSGCVLQMEFWAGYIGKTKYFSTVYSLKVSGNECLVQMGTSVTHHRVKMELSVKMESIRTSAGASLPLAEKTVRLVS